MAYLKARLLNFGAFGEQITTHKSPIVQISNRYQRDPSNIEEIETLESAGGTADNNGNLFRCQTGTSSGAYSIIQSSDTLNYRPGQGVECQITARFATNAASSLQLAGLISLTESLGFGYNGTSFSIIHEYNGAAEVQKMTVTASGGGTTTVTLDGDSVGIATLGADTVQTTAEKLRAGLVGDATLNAKWKFEQVDDIVYAISKSVGNKTGTMSVTGASTVSISEATQGVSKTSNNVAQGSWDKSPFSGFDPTKINVYKIQFGYLGAANLNFFLYNPNTGEFELVHSIKWANANSVTHLGSPNLKAGWKVESLGSTTNLTIEGASASIMLEGDEVIVNNTFASNNQSASVTTSLVSILTIKNRSIFNDRHNLGKVFPISISVDNDHNKGSIVSIYRNATIAGTQNYQFQNEFNSTVIVDTAGTTVTGGTLIKSLTVAANGSVEVDLTTLKTELLPDDTFTLAVKTISGTSTNITAAITWKEEK